MNQQDVLVLDASERMQMLRALLWALLAWSDEAGRGNPGRIEKYFPECDRLEQAIVDVVSQTGAVGVPVSGESAACLRAVADTCADAQSPAVAELAVVLHEMARRSSAAVDRSREQYS